MQLLFQAHWQRICIAKVLCMKTCEELYCKVHQSPRQPRVTLVPNSQHNRKDLPITDSRKSHDCESEEHKHKETCSRVDFRIPGIPHSTVQQVETNRKETVRRLMEQFENLPNRNMLLKDFEKSEEINHFNQESKDLILRWAIPKSSSSTRPRRRDRVQIALCVGKLVSFSAHAEKCVQPSENSRQFNNDRFDILSITLYVLKKSQSRGARHGQSLRQTMYHIARDMLRKTKLPKNGQTNNQIKSKIKRAIIPTKEEKAMTGMLWLL